MVTITAEWKNKKVARQKVAQMKEHLGGEYRTLVDNTVAFAGKGKVEFSPIGAQSKQSIEMLISLVNGKSI